MPALPYPHRNALPSLLWVELNQGNGFSGNADRSFQLGETRLLAADLLLDVADLHVQVLADNSGEPNLAGLYRVADRGLHRNRVLHRVQRRAGAGVLRGVEGDVEADAGH